MNDKTTYLSILYKCPAGEILTDCLIYEKDHLLLKDKFQWLVELSKGRKDAIIKHHNECLNKRRNSEKCDLL